MIYCGIGTPSNKQIISYLFGFLLPGYDLNTDHAYRIIQSMVDVIICTASGVTQKIEDFIERTNATILEL